MNCVKTEVADTKEDLAELLTAKFKEGNTHKIAVESLEKTISEFDGFNVPVKSWLQNFEQIATVYNYSNIQRFVDAEETI